MRSTGYVHAEKKVDMGGRGALIQGADDNGRWDNEHAMTFVSVSGVNTRGREFFLERDKMKGYDDNGTGERDGYKVGRRDHGDLHEGFI